MTLTYHGLVAVREQLAALDLPEPMSASALSGLEIVGDPNMVWYGQFRFPRSKKRRIRRKWMKRPANWRWLPKPYAIRWGNRLICHPVMAQLLREKFKEVR